MFVTTHYMDEAERCHRVALMHAGRLLALDTRARRSRRVFPAGTVVEIACPRPAQALARLEALPGVGEVALFGDRLHVVLDDPARAATHRGRASAAAGFAPVDRAADRAVARGRLHPRRSAPSGRSPAGGRPA